MPSKSPVRITRTRRAGVCRCALRSDMRPPGCRGSGIGGAFRRRLSRAPRSEPAVLQRGQAARGCGPARRGRSRRRTTPGRSPACASTTPQGSTISERPWLARGLAVAPHCAGASTKAWFSIARARSSTSQWSLPVSRREGARHREEARAARGERAVELGEAQVVADREPDHGRRASARPRPPRPARRRADSR